MENTALESGRVKTQAFNCRRVIGSQHDENKQEGIHICAADLTELTLKSKLAVGTEWKS
jgi:hypothetical protein